MSFRYETGNFFQFLSIFYFYLCSFEIEANRRQGVRVAAVLSIFGFIVSLAFRLNVTLAVDDGFIAARWGFRLRFQKPSSERIEFEITHTHNISVLNHYPVGMILNINFLVTYRTGYSVMIQRKIQINPIKLTKWHRMTTVILKIF